MDLGSVGDKIKSIPPLVWVGVAAVLIFIFVMSKGGSSTGATAGVAAAGGDGSGDTPPDIGQEVTSLFDLLRSDAADRASFQSQLSAWLTTHATPSAGGGGTGGSTTPIIPRLPNPSTPTSPATYFGIKSGQVAARTGTTPPAPAPRTDWRRALV